MHRLRPLSPLLNVVDKTAHGLPCVAQAVSLFLLRAYEHPANGATHPAPKSAGSAGRFTSEPTTTGAGMTEAEEWRMYIAELRQVAAQADDAERQRKLLDLAERWTQFADELSGADQDRH
jgi:hypothetical protein